MIRFSNIASTYNEYLDSLYSYAIHLGFDEETAMDAIHDVFYKLCTKHASLDEISNIKFYLFRSLRNRLIDLQRTNKEYTGILSLEENLDENVSFRLEVSVEDELIDREDAEEVRQKVEKVLSILTNREREIMYLRYVQEYRYEEISEIMHISVAASRNLMSKSLFKLKKSALPLVTLLMMIR
ncbi:MAG TPA: sigma-70 family RNA polymerase sigma factor [Porphyromonadaceae bacterium]|jgi:RNA polymerase sigma factor (sigma-70 family)|uniref:RNA polymerase sigma factor n=1 Tax=Limibacterium fermenti TaxID=3229863 RepID=UPI000E9237B0|nr:sigma-70 family RNA polymerase sigma factor [Porphyromonadaceae bacterium]HBL33876.1 sigma-70 family RNA polymerase sigma factor [Porphyromonadaceae bacterium]HBX18825.1 sigma-70 family RNA polymerase sigma factor [Porphyromonadaceae bacterium]HBX45098.1 sigma-70 family RNA polymerase sigma factor [Porphyromonadaceae bacterium]HCM20576.1 sigma-70 family RNA polymerase sigma factor [Porphyromonadaceae bacterium]